MKASAAAWYSASVMTAGVRTTSGVSMYCFEGLSSGVMPLRAGVVVIVREVEWIPANR